MNQPVELQYLGTLDMATLKDLRRRLHGTLILIDRTILALSMTSDEKSLTTKTDQATIRHN